MQVTGGAAQVHGRHVILARVGNGQGLHFSAFFIYAVQLTSMLGQQTDAGASSPSSESAAQP